MYTIGDKLSSIERLNVLCEELNKLGISSYNDLEIYNNNSGLDRLINSTNIINTLRYEMEKFYSILFSDKTQYYWKKIYLEKYLFPLSKCNAQYALCIYLRSLESYRYYPLLLQTIAQSLNIYPYNNKSLNDYIDYFSCFMDIKYVGYDSNLNKTIFEPSFKFPLNTELYNKYTQNYDPNGTDAKNKEQFFIWSEQTTFIQEHNLVSQISNYSYPFWVAKEFGDGYGFDILGYDHKKNKEKITEVKSGLSDDFSLTINEYNEMKKCCANNADYYIDKYTCYDGEGQINKSTYLFLPDSEKITDIATNKDYYLEPTDLYDSKNGETKKVYTLKRN